ncbi:kinase-like domain-containing protein [Gorgonomyces haynaldii]|nr:kinase-like domain-containing protein [Gorgonomyces haynaldii]
MPQTHHIVGDYRLGRLLGKGAFGKVYLAWHRDTQETVAMKQIDREETIQNCMTDFVKNEIDILKKLPHHPHIVNCLQAVATQNHIYITMEMVSGGELMFHIKGSGLTEQDCKCFFLQLMEAVQFCHCNSICHRDIKPSNILLTADGRIKLSDFGLAAKMDKDGKVSGIVGTPALMAPEVSAKPYRGAPADIWSCGVVLYLMMAVQLPFKDRIYKLSIPKRFSKPLTDLLQQILVIGPKKRLTGIQILRHPWLCDAQHQVNLIHRVETDVPSGPMTPMLFLKYLGVCDIHSELLKFVCSGNWTTVQEHIISILCRQSVIFRVHDYSIHVQAQTENALIVFQIHFWYLSRLVIVGFDKLRVHWLTVG